MQTECISGQLEFEGFDGRHVVAAFDGGAVTSDAGALLLRETDRAIRLIERVAACFSDGRDPGQLIHALPTLVGQRIVAIALGYEDVNDPDRLRFDPVLALFGDSLEAKRKDCAPLAGKSTMNRLEHAPGDGGDLYHKIGCDRIAAADFRPNWQLDRRADGAEVALGLVRITHQVRNVDDRWGVLGNRRRRVDDDQVYAASSAERGRDTSDTYHVSARPQCLRAQRLLDKRMLNRLTVELLRGYPPRRLSQFRWSQQ